MTAAIVSDDETWVQQGGVEVIVTARPGAVRLHGVGDRRRVWLDMSPAEAQELRAQLGPAIEEAERWIHGPSGTGRSGRTA